MGRGCWWTQFVRCGENESSVGSVTCDVPQASVIGPLLFISYINDVSKVIKYNRFHIYADDVQIFHSVLVFRIYKGVMVRSTWICSKYMSGQRLMD
jgi:hypothetical protein